MDAESKSIISRWFAFVFSAPTGSVISKEKSSCEKKFSLALTRREVVMINSIMQCRNPHVWYTNEARVLAQKIEELRREIP